MPTDRLVSFHLQGAFMAQKRGIPRFCFGGIHMLIM